MISIIICSIDNLLLKQIVENIKSTIGVPFEIIVHDNSQLKWGLCKVYNYNASKATYPFLCFIHEDVLIHTDNWGQKLVDFTNSEENCGIIGFAGSKYVVRNHIDWEVSKSLGLISCYRYNEDDKMVLVKNFTSSFEKAIILDGMFLFLSKNVWLENKFDEELFKGFHLYDSDFSFSISQNYQNYVCSDIEITHFCKPKFNKSFCDNLIVFDNKWKRSLPMNKFNVSLISSFELEFSNAFRFTMLLLSNNYSLGDIFKHLHRRNNMSFLMVFYPYLVIKIIINSITKVNRAKFYLEKLINK